MGAADEKGMTERTGVDLSLVCYWWWQPLFYFCTPRVRLNGTEYLRRWGRHIIETPPGEVRVHISFPYFGQKESCPADASLTVAEGRLVKLEYRPPFTIFQRGQIRVK